ncbi:MAG: nicotinate phosphoribosyltransferase [Desulfurococcales archaeon]|nr:nicotinate phosphoribosyltransferase [Desulfurococcales archaeon]
MKEPRLYMATQDEILNGLATDIYFIRTKKILEEAGLEDTRVRAEVHAYSLPKGYEWAVFAGLEEAIALLKGRNVTVYSIPEGTIFRRKDPLMIIEGRPIDFLVMETALLGVLRFSTSIATKAARIRLAAGDKTVLFFGLRATHPAVQPAADRAAYIGGLDGVSGNLSRKYLNLEPKGTMPHALIIAMGDQKAAWRWYAKIFRNESPVIALVDTFLDERVEALMAAEELGEDLYGVRLDTPSSRRGKMRDIVEEVRWALDIHGYRHVKIFVSGGIDEESITELRDIVDGFGVGTSIAWPPNIDISMDIVEVEKKGKWIPISKRGKLPGARTIYQCPDGSKVISLLQDPMPCKGGKKMMEIYIKDGKLVKEFPTIDEIRSYVLKQLSSMSSTIS